MSRTSKASTQSPAPQSRITVVKAAASGKVSFETEGVKAQLSPLEGESSGLWLEVEISHPKRRAAVLVQALTENSAAALKESFLMQACMCVRQWREAGLLSDEKALKALVREMGLVQAPVTSDKPGKSAKPASPSGLANVNHHPASSALH